MSVFVRFASIEKGIFAWLSVCFLHHDRSVSAIRPVSLDGKPIRDMRRRIIRRTPLASPGLQSAASETFAERIRALGRSLLTIGEAREVFRMTSHTIAAVFCGSLPETVGSFSNTSVPQLPAQSGEAIAALIETTVIRAGSIRFVRYRTIARFSAHSRNNGERNGRNGPEGVSRGIRGE